MKMDMDERKNINIVEDSGTKNNPNDAVNINSVDNNDNAVLSMKLHDDEKFIFLFSGDNLVYTFNLKEALHVQKTIDKILRDLEIKKEIMNIFPESLKLHLYDLMDVSEMTFDCMGDAFGDDKSDKDLFRIRVKLVNGDLKEYCRQIVFARDLETFHTQMMMIPDSVDVFFTNFGSKWIRRISNTDVRKVYPKEHVVVNDNDGSVYFDIVAVDSVYGKLADIYEDFTKTEKPINIEETECTKPKSTSLKDFIPSIKKKKPENISLFCSQDNMDDNISPTSKLLNQLKGDSEENGDQIK